MLKPNDVVSLYEQLEEILKNKIITGELKSSERLPSIKEISNEYGISVITVRKAIQSLADEGLVETRQGKGTFVIAQKFKRDMNRIISFSESCLVNGKTPGSIIIEKKIIDATSMIKQKLALQNEEQVVFISRLRTVDGEPMLIEENHYPLDYAFLLKEDIENESVFNLIREKTGMNVAYAEREFEIIRAQHKEAALLQIHTNDPLLLIRAVSFFSNEKPVYYGKQMINGEKFRFTL